jgi:hypothetical protein
MARILIYLRLHPPDVGPSLVGSTTSETSGPHTPTVGIRTNWIPTSVNTPATTKPVSTVTDR